MKKKINYYMIHFFLFLGKILPKSTLYMLSKCILMCYYKLKPKRVEIMHENIKRAFPKKSEEEIVRFGKEVYTALSQTVAEYLLSYAGRVHIQEMVSNMDEACKKLRRLKSESQNGMIIVTGHYANWELFGDFLGYNGFEIINVVKRSPDSLIDQRIITPFREKYGNSMIDQKGSMVRLAKALKSNRMVTLLIDQVVQPPNGVVVNFFGHQTAATKSVAMLKNKYDPMVVPVFLERVGRENFMVRVGDPIEVDLENDEEQKLTLMTQRYYDAIEYQIRQAPEQWLWLYNRWKEIKFA